MTRTEMDPAVRERLLEVVLTELESKGRGAMSVAEVLEAADVEEPEFVAEYADLDRCLADAYEWLTIRMYAATRVGCTTGAEEVVDREADWPKRVRGGLEALIRELAARPELARVLTRTYPSLGPAQQARYQAFVEGFVSELRVRRELGGVDGDLPAEVDSLAVGAAEAIVFEEIASGRTEELPQMTASILFSVLVPFLGPSAAASEMEKAQQPL